MFYTEDYAWLSYYKEQIAELVRISDKDFVPPLSCRGGTCHVDFTPAESNEANLDKYLEDLYKQRIHLHIVDDKVIGLLSYIPSKSFKIGEGNNVVVDYISTVIVHPDYRGKGVARNLYENLEKNRTYGVRTWSTNYPQIALLEKMGFKEKYRIKNDRAEGIDTIHFFKESL